MKDTPRVALYDTQKLQNDMALRGWLRTDLARIAGISDQTVGRFLKGEAQTAKTADKIARALGYTVRRYYLPTRRAIAS